MITKQNLTASINLDKIDKDHLYVTEKGVKYLNLKLVFRGERGQYNDIGFIVQSPLKAKDEQGEYINLEILGNIKEFPSANTETTQPKVEPIEPPEDDLPF